MSVARLLSSLSWATMAKVSRLPCSFFEETGGRWLDGPAGSSNWREEGGAEIIVRTDPQPQRQPAVAPSQPPPWWMPAMGRSIPPPSELNMHCP